VVEGGAGDRVLLGGDVARRTRYVAYGGMPGLAYLFERFVPRVRQAVGDAVLGSVLVANPARWLSWDPER
jgi:phosphotriesterase-related protein